MGSKRMACTAIGFVLLGSLSAWGQQPPEPVDRTPQDGQAYALMNQATATQLAIAGSAGVDTAARDLGNRAPNDVEMPDGGGPYSTFQKEYTTPNALFAWEGLGLFDSADPDYLTDPSAPNYSTALPGLDAVGGKEDATLIYKLVSRSSGLLLSASGQSVGTSVLTALSGIDGSVNTRAQWHIASNNSGAFTVANVHGSPAILDGSASTVVDGTANGAAGQQWDVQTAGNGFYYLVNQAKGSVLNAAVGQSANTVPLASAGTSAQWAIIPVAISTEK